MLENAYKYNSNVQLKTTQMKKIITIMIGL